MNKQGWILALLALPLLALADLPVVVPKSPPPRTVPLNFDVKGPAVSRVIVRTANFQSQFRAPTLKPLATDFTSSGALRLVRTNFGPLFEPWSPPAFYDASSSHAVCRSNDDMLSTFDRYAGCDNGDFKRVRNAQRQLTPR